MGGVRDGARAAVAGSVGHRHRRRGRRRRRGQLPRSQRLARLSVPMAASCSWNAHGKTATVGTAARPKRRGCWPERRATPWAISFACMRPAKGARTAEFFKAALGENPPGPRIFRWLPLSWLREAIRKILSRSMQPWPSGALEPTDSGFTKVKTAPHPQGVAALPLPGFEAVEPSASSWPLWAT